MSTRRRGGEPSSTPKAHKSKNVRCPCPACAKKANLVASSHVIEGLRDKPLLASVVKTASPREAQVQDRRVRGGPAVTSPTAAWHQCPPAQSGAWPLLLLQAGSKKETLGTMIQKRLAKLIKRKGA